MGGAASHDEENELENWRVGCSSVGERLEKYWLQNPDKGDVKFLVGPDRKLVKAWKLQLILTFSQFEYRFLKEWKDYERLEISLPDLNPEAFQIFLQILCFDCISVQSLVKLNLSFEDIAQLKYIGLHFGSQDFVKCTDQVLSLMIPKFPEFINTDEFLKLSQRALTEILSHDEINVPEERLFHLLMKWGTHVCMEKHNQVNTELLRNEMGEAVYAVRFPLLSGSFISGTVRPQNLLNEQELTLLLSQKFLSPNSISEITSSPFIAAPRKPITTIDLTMNSRGPGGILLLPLDEPKNSSWRPNQTFGHISIQFNLDVKLLSIGFKGPENKTVLYTADFQVYESKNKPLGIRMSGKVLSEKPGSFAVNLNTPLHLNSGQWYNIVYTFTGSSPLMNKADVFDEQSAPFKHIQRETTFGPLKVSHYFGQHVANLSVKLCEQQTAPSSANYLPKLHTENQAA